MMTFMFISAAILPILFLFLNHPLSFGLILLLQTLIIALITGMMSLNFWFSYILFLIMVGGMLILFIYMTSIASNEKFKFSQNLFILLTLTLIIMIMVPLTTDQFMQSLIMSTNDLTSFTETPKSNFSMIKYLNNPTYSIMYMMFMYLLITLIMVVKITNISYGPIRQKF